MGTPAFPNLGEHCAVRECNLVDFLPFTCDGCNQIYCLEHRTYGNHQCPKARKEDVTALVCPVCAKAVRLIPKEDPNETWERHVRINCDPNNYTKVTQKPRCPVQGCKELLTFSNKVRCKDCGREVCLKHRFGSDHSCQELRKADASKNNSYFSNQFSKLFRDHTPGGSYGKAKTGVSAASMKDKMLGLTTGPLRNPVKSVQPTGLTSSRPSFARELCPQCGMRFTTVVELIQHAETAHSSQGGQWRVGSSQDQLDVCPKCGKGFSDAILLVNHVEKDHGGTSSDTGERCTIS